MRQNVHERRPDTRQAIPAAAFLLAAVVGFGVASACSNGVTLTSQAAPLGVTYPPGVTIGGACQGEIYFADGGGYVYCLNGLWAFTLDDPGSDDYTVDSSDASYVESSDSGEGIETEDSDDTESASSEESSESSP